MLKFVSIILDLLGFGVMTMGGVPQMRSSERGKESLKGILLIW
jgi:hypothetical protein